MNNFLTDKSGVSLIVATIFTAVMMLIVASLAQVTIATIRNISNFNFSDMAENIAMGASQIAYQFAQDNAVGTNAKIDGSNTTYVEMDDYIKFIEKFGVACANIDSDPNPTVKKPCAGFRVIGRTEDQAVLEMKGDNTLYNYSVPAVYKDDEGNLQSTGSAASECKDAFNADDPCHWNKLYLNDATEIPLYVEGPSVTPFSQIKIRVRSPCGEFKFDEAKVKYECTENVELYPKVSAGSQGNPSPFRKIDKDKVLVQWLILGGDGMVMAGDESKLDEDKQTNVRPKPKINGDGSITDKNTEISAGRINDAKGFAGGNGPLKDFLGNYVVLDEKYSGMYLNEESIKFKDLIDSKSQLKLYFNLVGTPRREDNNDDSALEFTKDQLNDSKYFLPYLEYQILTDEPIADSTTSLFGWAEIADFYKTSEGKRTFPVTTEPFTLGNL